MKSIQVMQSSKSRNATRITELHEEIRHNRHAVKRLYEVAQHMMRGIRADQATVKALAKQQIEIKKHIKGPPKKARAKKADSRIPKVANSEGIGSSNWV